MAGNVQPPPLLLLLPLFAAHASRCGINVLHNMSDWH